MKNEYDVVVIGGGPAGLAAAISAAQNDLQNKSSVLLIEREANLGGVLKQCIHDGFGLLRFGERLSGCEYATRFIHELNKTNVDVSTKTFVTRITKLDSGFELQLVNRNSASSVLAKALVLATGCRERTAKQVAIHGTRPSGIFTAGSAQAYINLYGQMPGKNIVILGSGDIGLIMARRLTLEGANVIAVYEAKPEVSGLSRNVYQCLNDFDIPLHLSQTVIETHGRERLNSVTVASVDEKMNVIAGTEKEIPCDTLILSVGLIPENELATMLNIPLDKKTKGPICDQNYMTMLPGVFSCGNSLHVNDLVDYVSLSGEQAGSYASVFAHESKNRNYDKDIIINVKATNDFLYVVPSVIRINPSEKENNLETLFFFRSSKTRGSSTVSLQYNGNEIYSKNYNFLRPPEMEKISIKLDSLVNNNITCNQLSKGELVFSMKSEEK